MVKRIMKHAVVRWIMRAKDSIMKEYESVEGGEIYTQTTK